MLRLVASFVSVLLVATAPLRAQCTTQPVSLGGVPGASSAVGASAAWDPDGAGPAGSVPVIGGAFSVAGTALVNGIAWFDAAANDWRPFGSGVGAPGGAAGWLIGGVAALLPLPNGDLVVGGTFPSAGGVPAANVAVWTNGAWAPLGSGIGGSVYCLARLPTGEIVAGGSFTTAGGVPASNLAVWNGTSWSQAAGGLPSPVSQLAVLANGSLAAGGTSGTRIWNGGWTTLSTEPTYALTAAPGGGLIWSSRYWTWHPSPPPFGTSTPVSFVAATIGGVTTYLQIDAAARAFDWLPNGDLLATWNTAAGDTVQRWNGTTWTPFAASLPGGTIVTMARQPNGDLLAGGWIDYVGNVAVKHVAMWNGQTWTRLGDGFDTLALAVVERPNGDLVVGGAFGANGVLSSLVAQWNGTQWSGLGTFGVTPGQVHAVNALATLPNGDLVVGGSFSSAGGVAAANIARWDGTSWWALGAGVSGRVGAAIVDASGQLVVGSSGVSRWNGTAWSTLGSASDGGIAALAEAPNGDLVAAGAFATIGGVAANHIARWTGSGWQPLGSGMNDYVWSLAFLPNGDLVAGGAFTSAGGTPASRVARWNGASWSPLGSGLQHTANALLVLPDGDLLAAGSFTAAGGVPAERLARWDGTSWSAFGGGLDDLATSMRLLSTGEIVLAGRFTVAGGIAAGYVATLAPTCPAGVAVSGAGCTGTGGPNVLDALSRPWLGATVRARATGLAPSSLALGVFGLGAAAVPLTAVLPQGGAGCMLLATPDFVDLQLVPGTAATTQLALPNVLALVGLAVHHQVVAIELGAGGITALTSTNALVLTLGAL